MKLHYSGIPSSIKNLQSYYFIRNFVNGLRTLFSGRIEKAALLFLLFVILLGVFGPILAPYNASETHYDDDSEILRLESPSMDHPLGTNNLGQDLLSRVLIGAQPTMLTGLMVGMMIFVLGLSIGVTAGYLGGTVDTILMRLTDFIYSVPLLPTAIILVALLGQGLWSVIFLLGILMWRGMARVVRSQVLQIKERPYILGARATGAGPRRIIVKHIFPNVAPMAILFTAIGAGYAIIIEAGLSFLGVTDPYTPTWGVILRNAHQSGHVADAVWWTLPPGFLISFTVLSAFLIGRGYEGIDDEIDQGL